MNYFHRGLRASYIMVNFAVAFSAINSISICCKLPEYNATNFVFNSSVNFFESAQLNSTIKDMKRIGNYCYDEDADNLGEGSFGAVYKGRHVQDSQQMVAIKTLNLRRTIFKSMRPEFLDREIAILQDLSAHPHPNLVHLLHCERAPDNIHLIMEFCNGGDLGDYLKVTRVLDESTILRFFKQIASGMKFLHDRSIVHRDLKPENVLLCFTGDRYPASKDITLKIADFGVGKFLAPDATTETFCGSYYYMAPEIRSNKPYNNRVDLWSVGVMMFQCLTGDPIERLKGAPDFTKLELPPGTSQSLSNLLRSLLVRDPLNRLDGDKFLNHGFFGETIGVSVRGPGGSKMIQTSENANVDVLISSVSSVFGLASEPGSLYLIYEGRQLEYGSGSSLKDSGISHGSTVEFCQRLPGGIRLQLLTPRSVISAE